MKVIRFLWQYMKPYNYQLICIFIDVLCYASGMLLAPLVISIVVDHVIPKVPFDDPWLLYLLPKGFTMDQAQDYFWIWPLLIIGLYIIVAIAIHLRSMHGGNLSETLALNIRNDLYDHLQTLPFAYHKSKDSGDLLQRSTSDIETIRRFFATQVSEMIFAIFNAGMAMIILFQYNVKLTLISISIIPLILCISFLFFHKIRKIFLLCDQAESAMTSVLHENLNGVRVVKAFHQEKQEIDKFNEKNDHYCNQYYQLLHVIAMYWSSTDFLGMVQIMLMVLSGIFFALDGQISIGTFFIFMMYESMIVWPLRQLGRILADMGKVSVAAKRIMEVLEEPSEDLDQGLKPAIFGDIVFDHVSFAYPDQTLKVLDDVSFTIQKGSTIAIMGPTGSGKSSLMYLLTAIYDYQQGHIMMDGVELKDIAKQWLRKHIQIVLQEPFLYSKTIYENIAMADANASEEDVMNVCKMAAIHDDIMSFEHGYQTLVGEKGVTLSGGQKQRVAIARSLLAKSPILILDDSLSALDTNTDALIQHTLHQQHQDETILMITHRVTSAMKADQIIVLEHGKITAMGTHDQLMKQEGLYQRIYRLQQGGDYHA